MSFLLTLTPESESAKVTQLKCKRISLLSVKQMNYHDYTEQGWLLVGRQTFNVLYKNPKQGDLRIMQIIEPIQSS